MERKELTTLYCWGGVKVVRERERGRRRKRVGVYGKRVIGEELEREKSEIREWEGFRTHYCRGLRCRGRD